MIFADGLDKKAKSALVPTSFVILFPIKLLPTNILIPRISRQWYTCLFIY